MQSQRRDEIEQFAFALLDKRRKDMGLTAEEWGLLAFPELSPSVASQTIYTFVRPQSTNKKPRRLRYSDFIALACALGISPIDILAYTMLQFPDISQLPKKPQPAPPPSLTDMFPGYAPIGAK